MIFLNMIPNWTQTALACAFGADISPVDAQNSFSTWCKEMRFSMKFSLPLNPHSWNVKQHLHVLARQARRMIGMLLSSLAMEN